MKKIILITGGRRSGKSRYAQEIALSLSAHPVYLATSRVWDDEHLKRIERHKAERTQEWVNLEEDKKLGRHRIEGKTVLIDCLTLWATNYFFDLQSDTDKALAELKAEFDIFTEQEAQFIFVTNEIGMGEIPQNEIQRKFSDLQGWINQYVAAKANEVYLMVSGVPVRIK
jgi:adenosylcobinamide kinase/adenosylcobinamide-phosphate guanylyltransferase